MATTQKQFLDSIGLSALWSQACKTFPSRIGEGASGTWNIDITGNAKTATTAEKLSTQSKTAWGKTFWTAGGIPQSISGDMTNVGKIDMTGNLTLSSSSGDSPSLIFKRGTNADNLCDWTIVDVGGYLTFRETVNGTTTDIIKTCGSAGKTTFKGTVTADGFSGPLTGNVIGNVTGNVTGNATTATTATTANNALTLNGVGSYTVNGSGYPFIQADGVMEIGRYLDFHMLGETDGIDFSGRLYCQTETKSKGYIWKLPNKSGELACLTDIPSTLPANGGNADTVDNKHASDFATSSHVHVIYDCDDSVNIPNDSHTHNVTISGNTGTKGAHTHTFTPTGSIAVTLNNPAVTTTKPA
jgi:hypothetical protein